MDDFNLKVQGAIGIIAMLALCYAFSTSRKSIKPRIVFYGLGLQFLFAFLILRTEPGRDFFARANEIILTLLGFSEAGAVFLFGQQLGTPGGAGGFVFAFHVLTTIIFFASLMSILYHYGIMQRIVSAVAWVMQRTLGTSGAETLSASANIFVGQTEAPLLVRPFIKSMTKSEIMTVMTGGFATVAGGVMATYVGMLKDVFPDIAGHLLAASVMAAPGGIVISKILFPETESPKTSGTLEINVERTTRNGVDAAAAGASDGLQLALNVGAMLFAFVALVKLLDGLLGWGGSLVGIENASLEGLFMYLFSPLAYAMGVAKSEVFEVSKLLGTKMVATEFVAFDKLSKLGETLSARTMTMSSYALCGFANLASIAIQIGGISAMAPERRSDLAQIGLKAMFAGFLTTCLTATIAGLMV